MIGKFASGGVTWERESNGDVVLHVPVAGQFRMTDMGWELVKTAMGRKPASEDAHDGLAWIDPPLSQSEA